jgi:hypothetical protein
MDATKDLPPEAQDAFADRLSLPPEVRKAVGALISARKAPDAATREMNADEKIRTDVTEENVTAAINEARISDTSRRKAATSPASLKIEFIIVVSP